MQPNPLPQYRAERQIERFYLVKEPEKKIYPGETLPADFWDWTELEVKALKHMIRRGEYDYLPPRTRVEIMAQYLKKKASSVAVAIILLGEEGKL